MFIKSAKQQFSYFPLIAAPFRPAVSQEYFFSHPLISALCLVFGVLSLPGEALLTGYSQSNPARCREEQPLQVTRVFG